MQYHQGIRLDDIPLRRLLSVHLEMFVENHNEFIRFEAALSGMRIK